MREICFVLVPEFPLYALVPAIEALRLANQNAGTTLYDWVFASCDGGPVTAGNGMVIEATQPLSSTLTQSFAIVCAGNDPTRMLQRELLDWLHRRAVFGTRLGALALHRHHPRRRNAYHRAVSGGASVVHQAFSTPMTVALATA